MTGLPREKYMSSCASLSRWNTSASLAPGLALRMKRPMRPMSWLPRNVGSWYTFESASVYQSSSTKKSRSSCVGRELLPELVVDVLHRVDPEAVDPEVRDPLLVDVDHAVDDLVLLGEEVVE